MFSEMHSHKDWCGPCGCVYLPPMELGLDFNRPPRTISRSVYTDLDAVLEAVRAASTLSLGVEIQNYRQNPNADGVIPEAWLLHLLTRGPELDELQMQPEPADV